MHKNWFVRVLWLTLFTSFLAVSALVIHETFHVWASVLEGGGGIIDFDWDSLLGIPIPTTGYARGVVMSPFVKIAGGLGTGIIFLAVGKWAKVTSTFQDYYVEFAFTLCGVCHLLYSIWEVTMLHNIPMQTYLFLNNVIFSIIIVSYLIVERKNIWRYIL